MAYAGVRPGSAGSGRSARWSRSGWATGCTTCRRSCRAASSSGWRSPARSSTDPVLLLADEPTGALDSHSTADVLALFDDLNADGRTIVVITHEEEVAHHAKRVVRMRDGRIVADAAGRGAVRSSAAGWAGAAR